MARTAAIGMSSPTDARVNASENTPLRCTAKSIRGNRPVTIPGYLRYQIVAVSAPIWPLVSLSSNTSDWETRSNRGDWVIMARQSVAFALLTRR
jgi:hypothetical protein